jgi:hypothetical protein
MKRDTKFEGRKKKEKIERVPFGLYFIFNFVDLSKLKGKKIQ